MKRRREVQGARSKEERRHADGDQGNYINGNVQERNMKVDYRWGEDLIAIIDNVPTGVCEVCGEQYFKAEVVKKMERLAHSAIKPKKIIRVPLMDLAINL